MDKPHYPVEDYCLNRFTSKNVKEVLRYYGFSEVADIFSFLNFTHTAELGTSELAYIREKVSICLRRNDNGDNYFIALREFATDLDCLRVIK
ncbi:hypothetical protein EpCFBP13511_24040 [Erwinia persicina]|uniref:Uncharacterized protein n=1 Tax=Erwinia persicina TaxID=55211 RepID=A0A4U3ESN8_9GAMM|nr:hypothetical protein EpCFBP13511_24040 [Erwinia persicina]